MDDIDFPSEEAVDIKQETDDYDLPDNCLEVGSFVLFIDKKTIVLFQKMNMIPLVNKCY